MSLSYQKYGFGTGSWVKKAPVPDPQEIDTNLSMFTLFCVRENKKMVSDSVLEHPDRGAATGEEDEDTQTEEEEEEEEEDEDGYVVYKAQKVHQINFFHLLLSNFGTEFHWLSFRR